MRSLFLFGALAFLGAGCLSAPVQDRVDDAVVEPIVDDAAEDVSNTTDDAPSLLVPVDPNSDVEEIVVEPSDQESTEPPFGAANDEPVAEPEPTPAPSTVSFNVTAKQWSFSPTTITVKKGDRVRLSITSVDVRHGFALPTFDISETLQPGQTTTVEFSADQAGSFSFFCNVFCGDGHGAMTGTLVVTE